MLTELLLQDCQSDLQQLRNVRLSRIFSGLHIPWVGILFNIIIIVFYFNRILFVINGCMVFVVKRKLLGGNVL